MIAVLSPARSSPPCARGGAALPRPVRLALVVVVRLLLLAGVVGLVGGALPVGRAAAAPLGAERPFVYGITIADASPHAGRSFDLARGAGFTHAYVVLDWASIEPERGRFAWEAGRANDLDNVLAAARAHGLRLIVRLGRPPAWAGAPAAMDPADIERFAAGVAARAKGIAAAYEVLNEPNLAYEWGGQPDPPRYARLLAAASRGVRRGDAGALVVSAGLATHTGNAAGTIEDVDFLRGMYAAGARGTFDVLGMHPYGGNSPPDADPSGCGICFRRAELYRQVMVENGDAATSAWVTEFGYLHTTGTDLGQYNWLKLAPQQQADFLTAAFRHAYARWPWLSGMVAFNLDFDTVPWEAPSMGAYWFSLLNPDRSPRPAYHAMRDLPKPGAAAPLAVVSPAPVPPAASAPAAVPATAAAVTTPSSPPSPSAAAVPPTADVVCVTRRGVATCGPPAVGS